MNNLQINTAESGHRQALPFQDGEPVTIENLNRTQEHNKELGGKLLGSIISWKIKRNTLIKDNDLWNAINNYQIPNYLHPKQIKTLSAFRKAIAKVDKELNKENLMLRYIKKTEDKTQGVLVALVEENKLINEQKLEYDNLGTIHYKNDVITTKLNPQGKVMNLIYQWYDFYKSYSNEDINHLLVNFANREGIRLLPTGGAYFISEASLDLMNRLKLFIKDIHPENNLFSFEIYGLQQQKDLEKVAENNFEKELKTLLKESQNFLAEADSDRKSYEKGINNRKQELRLIKKKLENMQQVLNLNTQKITINIQNLETTLNLGIQNEKIEQEINLETKNLLKEVGF